MKNSTSLLTTGLVGLILSQGPSYAQNQMTQEELQIAQQAYILTCFSLEEFKGRADTMNEIPLNEIQESFEADTPSSFGQIEFYRDSVDKDPLFALSLVLNDDYVFLLNRNMSNGRLTEPNYVVRKHIASGEFSYGVDQRANFDNDMYVSTLNLGSNLIGCNGGL